MLLTLATVHAGTTAAVTSTEVRTFAGSGVAGDAGDGGPATSAQLHAPAGLDVRPSGTVFIADRANHRVRRVDGGTITPLAGTGTAGYAGDGGPATSAQLDDPVAVAARPSGTVLIVDAGSHTVREVRAGVITTVAGSGRPGVTGDGGPAAAARLRTPQGVAVRPSGEFYIADTGNNAVRRVDVNGTITTVAGSGPPGYGGDGGAATGARLSRPAGMAVTASGTVYIADTGNHVVRRIGADGVISTVAGSGAPGYVGDGGPATAASLREPAAVVVGDDGGLLIADTGNHVVRKVDPAGRISTLAGTGAAGDGGDGGPARTTPLNRPAGVTVARDGVLVAESGGHRVRVLAEVAPPAAPQLARTDPPSPANHNEPRILGSAPAGTTVRLYTDSACAGSVAATGSAEALASPGLAARVGDDTTTAFHATATDTAGHVSACSDPLTYVEDSTPPAAPEILAAPEDPTDRTPTWRFAAESGATTSCQLARIPAVVVPYEECDRTRTYDLGGQPDGHYTFSVRAVDAAGNTGSAAVSTHHLVSEPPVPGPRAPSPNEPGTPDPGGHGDHGPGGPRDPGPGDSGPAPGQTGPGQPRPGTPDPWPGDPGPTEPALVVDETAGGSRSSSPTGPASAPRTATPSSAAPGPEVTAASGASTSRPGGQRDDADGAVGGDPRVPSPDTAGAGTPGDRSVGHVPTHDSGAPGAPQDRRRVLAGTVEALVSDIRAVGASLATDPAFPLVLLFVVGLFLAVQHFIDRSDPKLALAPVDNADLEFPELLPVRNTPPHLMVRNTPPHLIKGGSSWSRS